MQCLFVALEGQNKAPPRSEKCGVDRHTDQAAGQALFRQVYGSQADNVLTNLQRWLPGYEEIILQHAYGRILSGPELAVTDRELLAVAALLVSACPAQLTSHVLGGLRVGVHPDALATIARLIDGSVDQTGSEAGLLLVQELLAARSTDPPRPTA